MSCPGGDTADYYHLVQADSLPFKRFGGGGPAGNLIGAADVDRDGRIELTNGVHCFEWREDTFVFDRRIKWSGDTAPRSLGMVGDVLGDSESEILVFSGEALSIYRFK